MSVFSKCEPINDTTVINNFYGCPRKPFPTTTTTTSKTTTSKAPTKKTVTKVPVKGNTDENNGITSNEGNDGSDTDTSDQTNDQKRNKTFDGINDDNGIETTVGGNSGEQNDDRLDSVEPIDNWKTLPNDGQTVDDLSTTSTKDKDSQSLFKTWFTWVMTIVIICLILFVLILFAICFFKRCQTNEKIDKESTTPKTESSAIPK